MKRSTPVAQSGVLQQGYAGLTASRNLGFLCMWRRVRAKKELRVPTGSSLNQV